VPQAPTCSTATPPIRLGDTREPAIFGTDTQFYGWPYPPYFLDLAARGKRTVASLYRSGHDGRSADDRGHARVRSRYLERVSRLDQVHARRRAGAGRNGLAQDPKCFFGRPNVGGGISLAYAVQVAVTLAMAGGLA